MLDDRVPTSFLPHPAQSASPPYYLGITLSLVLYGTFLCQVISYWKSFPSDKSRLRLLIAYILVVETALTLYDTWTIGENLVHRKTDDYTHTNFAHGSYFELTRVHTILTAAISTPVQLFYAWRLRPLRASKLVTFAIYGFSATSFVTAIVTAAISPRAVPALDFLTDLLYPDKVALGSHTLLLVPTLTWLCSTALTDVLVTGGTSYVLLRSKTGFRRTDTMLFKIVRLTLEAGLLTSTCIILEMVLFILQYTGNFGGDNGIIWDGFAWYIIPDLILSKFYANMLLASLNARTSWRPILESGSTFCMEIMEQVKIPSTEVSIE